MDGGGERECDEGHHRKADPATFRWRARLMLALFLNKKSKKVKK
jgi:hypothetical protein